MAIYGINTINEMYDNSNEIFSFSEIFESAIIETNDVIRELNEYGISLQEATDEESKKSIINKIIDALKKIKEIFIRTITKIKNAITTKLQKISINKLKNSLRGVTIEPGKVDCYGVKINELYNDISQCISFSDDGATTISDLDAKKDQLNKIQDNFVKDYTIRREMSYTDADSLCRIADEVITLYSKMIDKQNKLMNDVDKRIRKTIDKLNKMDRNPLEHDDEILDRMDQQIRILKLAINVIARINIDMNELNNGVFSVIGNYV